MTADELLPELSKWIGQSISIEGKVFLFGSHVYFVPSGTKGDTDSQKSGIVIALPGISHEIRVGGGIKRGGYHVPSVRDYIEAVGTLIQSPIEPFAAAITDITALAIETHEGLRVVDLAAMCQPTEGEIQYIMSDPILTPKEKDDALRGLLESRMKW